MNKTGQSVAILFLCIQPLWAQADGVKIEQANEGLAVTAPAYTAKIDGNGSRSSLIINGVEFLRPR